MNNIKLIPFPLNDTLFMPQDTATKAVLQSFGFYDRVMVDYRTIEEWKRERAYTGTEPYIKFFIPTWVGA